MNAKKEVRWLWETKGQEVFSHVTRFFNRRVDLLLLALVPLFVSLLPGSAMASWAPNSGQLQHINFGKVGMLSAVYGLVGAQQKVQKLPFRYGTVLRRVTIGTFATTLGQPIQSQVIPQVGMLARVFVDVEGSYTKANATGYATLDGFDALINRAQVTLNNGSANVVDLSGIGINIVNKNLSLGLPIKRGLATTAGAQTFSYKFILPVNANNRRQFEMGLINLQAPELRANINLSFNPLTSLAATPADWTAFTINTTISYQYWEIPDPSVYALPPLTIVRSIEEAPIPIAATGDQVYQLPRLGTMINYSGVVVLNNLYSTIRTAVSEFRWRYNKTDTVFDVLFGDWETIESEFTDDPGLTFLSSSAVTLFLWAAGDKRINGGDFRDAIDTEENTTTESIITIASGTALNAGKDNIFHVRRVVQRIVAAPAPGAAA
jgi:hypothetical protein